MTRQLFRSARILAVSIAVIVAANCASADTTILNGQTLTVDPAAFFPGAGIVTINDNGTLQLTQGAQSAPPAPGGYLINNNFVFTGNAGTVNLQFNNNDTRWAFQGSFTSNAVGNQTLAIRTGQNGNGDREDVVFTNGIPDSSGGSTLGMDVTFGSQSQSTDFVNLSGGNTFSGNIALHQGNGPPTGYFVVGGERYQLAFNSTLFNTQNATPSNATLGTTAPGVGSYGGNITLDTGTIFNFNSTGTQALSGAITGNGSLLMSGTGTLTLTGINNTYSGGTTVTSNGDVTNGTTPTGTGGTLRMGAINALPVGGNVQLDNMPGVTLNLNGFSQSIGLLTGGGANGGNVTLGTNAVLTLGFGVTNASTSATFGGTISGAGTAGVTKEGAGTQSLTGAGTYTGPTIINNGTLALSANLTSSNVTVNNAATLGVSSSPLTLGVNLAFENTSVFQVGYAGSVIGSATVSGNLDVNGPHTLKLASNGSFAPVAGTHTVIHYGGSLVNSGSWTLDNSSFLQANLNIPDKTSHWISDPTTNASWDTASNWDQKWFSGTVVYDTPNNNVNLNLTQTGVVPFSASQVTIAPANTKIITGSGSPSSIASLTLGDNNGNGYTHTLNLQSAAPLSVSGTVTVNPSGTLNGVATALSAGTLNMSGGSVTVGPGSSAGTVNLTSGTLVANTGNELAVSNTLVQGSGTTQLTITAGANPFKVGGANLVSAINKLVLPSGTTAVAFPHTHVSVIDTTWQSSDTNPGGTANTTAALVSNPAFTCSAGANVLVVTVTQRFINTAPPAHAPYDTTTHPTVTYNGTPLTLNNGANGPYAYTGPNGFINSQVFYMLNPPTGAADNLAVSFPSPGTDYSVNAYTLGGVDTTQAVVTGGVSNAGTLSLAGLAANSAVVTSFMERTGTSTTTTASSGTLNTSGTGGGNGNFWQVVTGNVVQVGSVIQDVAAGTLTITESAPTSRPSLAAVAFAPTIVNPQPLNQTSMALDVTGTSTLSLNGVTTAAFGSLTMEAGSSLTPTGITSLSVSNIVATGVGTSSIAAGTPLSIRNTSSSIDVASGHTLTVGANITTTAGGGNTLEKTNSGTLNLTGNLYGAADPDNHFGLRTGTVNFVNSTGYYGRFFTGYGGVDTNLTLTNSNITTDGVNDNGDFSVGFNAGGGAVATCDMHGGSLSLVWGYVQLAPSGGGVRSIMTMDNNATINLNPASFDATLGSAIWMGDNGAQHGSTNFVMRNGSINATGQSFVQVGVVGGFNVFDQLGGTINVPADYGTTPNNGTPTAGLNLMYRMNKSDNFGIYNLGGSATLIAGAIQSGDGTAYGGSNGTPNNAYFNFHGGTLKPAADETNFVRTTLTGAPAGAAAPQLEVYAEGAVIDTNGHNITIQQPLNAPAGNGVTSGTFSLSNQGSGYKAAPIVYVTTNPALEPSAGCINGATAVANMVDDGTGNGTLKIASITITNPGLNFTSTPVLSISGGDPTTPASSLPSLSIAANVSGGLTKNGSGTLTLTAVNTYAGNTTITGGTLALSTATTSNIANSVKILVGDTPANSAATLNVTQVNTGGDGFHVMSGQTLAGYGTVLGNVTLDSGATLAPGNSAGTPLTIANGGNSLLGNLVLASGSISNFGLATSSSYDRVVGIKNITFGGALNVTTIGGGPTFAPGQVYDLFNFTGNVQPGTFSSISLPTLSGGLQWHDFGLGVDFNYANGQIQVDGPGSSGSGVWKNGNSDNLWTTNIAPNSNWSGGFPSVAGNVATFDDTVIGAPGLVKFAASGSGSITVGGVLLQTNSLGYTLGSSSADTLTLQVSSGTASIAASSGGGGASHTINAKVITASNAAISTEGGSSLSLAGGLDNSAGKAVSLTQSGAGSLTVLAVTNSGPGVVTVNGAVGVTGSITGTGNTTVSANANLTANSITQHALSIQGDATHTAALVTINPSSPSSYVAPGDSVVPTGNSSGTSILNSLAIANDGSGIPAVPGTGATASHYYGTLDLQNNNLVIDYTGSSNPVDTVRGAIQSAFAGGGWTGRGLTSSFIAGNPSAQYALGYSDNADPNNQFAPFASFEGTPVTSHSILVKFTWQDDLNLDGTVDINDASIFANTYDNGATTGHTFATADLNYDGVVDINDASIFANSYIVSPPLATLPEPSSIVLAGVGLVGLLFARRRMNKRNV